MSCRLLLLIIGGLLNTCAGNLEEIADCPRDCSKSINATPMMKFTTISESMGVDCRGVPAGQESTLEAIFQITGQGAGGGGEEDLPKAGIAVRPVMAQACISNQDLENEYRCIKTPQEEWCSNECGLISIKFLVACLGEGGGTRTMSINLASGGQVSKEVAITLQHGEGNSGNGGNSGGGG